MGLLLRTMVDPHQVLRVLLPVINNTRIITPIPVIQSTHLPRLVSWSIMDIIILGTPSTRTICATIQWMAGWTPMILTVTSRTRV